MPQRSEAWFHIKLGVPSASEFHRIVTPKELKLSKQHKDLLARYVAEWYLQTPLDSVETQWMQRGEDMEPLARKAYEFERDVEIQEVGFVTTEDGLLGCSPDGLIGTDGLIEIKAPSPQVHTGYLLFGTEDEYKIQAQGQLYIAEREWNDLYSYHPLMPSLATRYNRDEVYIAKLADALHQFTDLLAEKRMEMERRFGLRPEKTASPPDDPGTLGIIREDEDRIVENAFPREK
jgi:hypothetical protein